MDLLDALRRPEGKTLEFKRDLSSPAGLLRTVIAFANTAGGTVLVAPLCQASCRESEYPRELVYSLVGLRKLTSTYPIGSSSPQPTQSGFVFARDFSSFRPAQRAACSR